MAPKVSAYDSGCNGAGPYSTTTGQLCSTTPTTPSACAPGDKFSYLTGQPCSTTTTQNNSSSTTPSAPTFQIGARGAAVLAFQQMLENAGFSVGKIDGIYGKITAAAATQYYKTHPLPIVPVTPVSPTQTYSNSTYGVSFNYPNTWTEKLGNGALGTSNNPLGDYGIGELANSTSLVTVEIPATSYPSTDFDGAYLNLSINTQQLNATQCLALNPQNNSTPGMGTTTIDGVPFNWTSAGSAAAGTEFNRYSYSGYTNGNCYEFYLGDQVSAGSVGSNGITDVNNADITALKNVLNGVTFTTPVSTTTTSSVTISSLSPASGPTGTQVTITGSGFSSLSGLTGGEQYGVWLSGSTSAQLLGPNYFNNGTLQVTNDSSMTVTIPTGGCPGVQSSSCSSNFETNILPGTYSIYVLNANGASNSVSFTVTSGTTTQAPTITLVANPTSIAYGSSSTLTWNSTNATSCYNSWNGANSLSGTINTGTLTNTTNYSVTCTNSAGVSASASATVNVLTTTPTTPAITITSSTSSAQWAQGSTHTISWVDITPIAQFGACPVSLSGGVCPTSAHKYDISYFDKSMTNTILATGVSGSSYSVAIPSSFAVGYYTVKVCETGTTICGTSNGFNVVSGTTTTISVLSSPIIVSSNSTASQYIAVGNTVGAQNAAKVDFNFASNGSASTITELKFATNGIGATVNGNVTSVTVNGVTAPAVGGTAYLTGLNIPVPASGGGADVVAYISYAPVGPNGIPSGSAFIILTTVKYTSGSSVAYLNNLSVASPFMTLVGSKPNITLASSNVTLTAGTRVFLGTLTVTADTSGDIALAKIPVVASLNAGANSTANITAINLTDTNGVALPNLTSSCSGTTPTNECDQTWSSGNHYRIGAGQSKTFEIHANISGTLGTGASADTSIGESEGLGSEASFIWDDINGNNIGNLNGILLYNYPEGSVEIHN